jgi:hypothetical protein
MQLKWKGKSYDDRLVKAPYMQNLNLPVYEDRGFPLIAQGKEERNDLVSWFRTQKHIMESESGLRGGRRWHKGGLGSHT